MEVNALTWTITVIVVLGLLAFDFVSHVRSAHEPSMWEATGWMLFYMALAAAFGMFLWFTWGGPEGQHDHAIEFFAGYITELSLSIDNLFIFALIIGSFKAPRAYQQKVLLIGIALALVFRGIFIALGAVVISKAAFVFYIFGAFLLYTAIKLVVDEVRGAEETHVDDMAVVKLVRRAFPVSSTFDGDRLLTRLNGRLMLTPLFICLLSIGFIDVMFAFDSIPAIFGLTQEAYIVFTANAFALMGLRQMYFLLDALLGRLVFLSYGLGVVLAFIGVKLLLHALHENHVPFINGGQPLHVYEFPTVLSLLIIVATLAVTAILSVLKSRSDARRAALN